MPSRGKSSSSDLSLSFGLEEELGAERKATRMTSSASRSGGSPLMVAALDDPRGPSPTSSPSPRPTRTHPIFIELPKATIARTPPEPLSARGDLPGAYFPLHEDPGAPIRRPHPFQHDATAACQRSIALTAISAPMMHPDNHYEHHSRAADAPPPPTLAQVDTSYLTPALQDQLLPQGKYYPSNYEQRHPEQALRSSRPALSPVVAAASSSSSCPSSFRSDPLARAEGAAMAAALAPEDESRRKMRQYQQDMIAQATVALGNTTKVGAKDARYGSLHKPRSPKLAPLGSPGPVTPMELEAAVGAAPGYLEHGASQEKRNREIIVAQETGLAAHST